MNKKYIQFDHGTVGNLLEQANYFQKTFKILQIINASLQVAPELKIPSCSHLRPFLDEKY